MTHPQPDRRAAVRPSRRANRPQAASNRVASDRQRIRPTPLHPLPPPHRTPAERPPPRRDRGMIAWARARAGKTVRETGGALKGQGKCGAGRIVGPFNPSYSGLTRVSERAGGVQLKARTAATNRRDLSRSGRPPVQTDVWASMPAGRQRAQRSATLSGVRPPAATTGIGAALITALIIDQSLVFPEHPNASGLSAGVIVSVVIQPARPLRLAVMAWGSYPANAPVEGMPTGTIRSTPARIRARSVSSSRAALHRKMSGWMICSADRISTASVEG